MRIQKKTLLVIITSILAAIFALYLWKFIKLPYKEIDIIGIYSSNKFNANNEIARYLFFILFPLSIFLILQIYLNEFSLKKIINGMSIKKNILDEKNNFSNLIKYLFLFFILLEFFSVDFTFTYLDLFHEGQRLSSAYKSLIDSSLWSGSYVTVGIFYETLSAKLIWQIFDHESIGLMRFADRIYILLCKLLIVLSIYKISQFLNLKFFFKNLFFIICSLILINLLFDYNTDRNDSEYLLFRELPVLLITYLFFEIISKKNFNKIIIFSMGTISIFSMFWSIDRGLISNLLILTILFYFIFTKNYKNGLLLLSSILISWLILAFYLGNEFNFFLNNTFKILSEINYIHGVIHPYPFSLEAESARSLKILISILFCLLFSINLFIKNTEYSNQFKIAMLFIAIVSFLTYSYNLGRSGGTHAREVFGYSIIFITILIFNYIFELLSKNNHSFKIIPKNNKFLTIFLVTFLFFSLNINFSKLLSFQKRFNNYVYLDDSYFLSNEENLFLADAKKIVKNYDCIQLFTNQAAYLYLLRKKNCTKYYFVWSIGSVKLQKEFISDIDKTELLISSDYDNKGHPTYKLPVASNYINENYSSIFASNNRIIFKKNN